MSLENKPSVVFIVSPNFGIMEQWLPVLSELKRKRSEINLIALFPTARIAAQIKPDNLLVDIAEDVFDNVIFKSWYGAWVLSDSFYGVKELQKKHAQPVLTKVLLNILKGKKEYKKIESFVERLSEKAARYYYSAQNVDLEMTVQNVKAVCFDIIIDGKKGHFKEIKKVFYDKAWFSMRQGVDMVLRVNKASHKDGDKPINRIQNVTTYIYSEEEKPRYKSLCGLEEHEMKVIGVPRHQKKWINYILKRSENNEVPESPYIFIVSRPIGPDNSPFSLKKRLKHLEEIKKLAGEIGYNIVVRLHPKETKDGLYEQVFGLNTYNKKWFISKSHPYILGLNSEFCIIFDSSIAIDMAVLGVPVVQLINYEGTEHVGRIKDSFGNTISPLQLYGFALGASSYGGLENKALKIISSRKDVCFQLKSNYENVFKSTDDPVELIVNDICKHVDFTLKHDKGKKVIK